MSVSPVNNSINPAYQPPQYGVISASSLGGGNDLKAGHFVINPYPVKPYSFYDEIKVDKNFYNELLNPHYKPRTTNSVERKSKAKRVFKTLLTWGVIIAGGVLAYKNAGRIKDFFTGIYNKILKK